MDDREARDRADVVDLAIGILEHPEPDRPWRLVLDGLVQRLGGCGAVLSEVHRAPTTPTTRTGSVLEVAPVGLTALPLNGLLGQAAADDPLIRHYLDTDDFAPRATADVVDVRAWRSTTACAMARELMGAASCVSLPLARRAGGHRGLTVTLPGTDLGERERRYLEGVHPLLIALDRHLEHLARWRRTTRADDRGAVRSAAEVGLTPRELTVLVLLAEARTAAAIGRRLRISPRTVHKHLENLYRKLGTTDRVSTVLRAQEAGLLPVRSSGS